MNKPTRPETGPMKFGDDWTGVFLRGDDAFAFAQALRLVLDPATRNPIYEAVVEGLLSTLDASVENGSPDEDPQALRPFTECQP